MDADPTNPTNPDPTKADQTIADRAGQHVAPLVPGLLLHRVLGRGGHGTVWEATDAVTGDRVAVKIGRRPHDPQAAREAALLSRVDHPHVVRLRNVVECPDGTRALVLDLAAGGSLADLVRSRGRLDPGETVTVVVGLARTLADLHGHGLVHGDLTPGNVLLAADGRPLIADLGVAGVLGRQPGERWGTPGFADPAVEPASGPAQDVYGLGALVRFCLTGSPEPVAGRGATSRTAAALLAVAARATSAEPDRRPGAAEVARLAWAAGPARPLRRAVEPRPAEPPPTDPGPAADRAADRVAVRVVDRAADRAAVRVVDRVAERDVAAAALLGRDEAGPAATEVTRRIREAAGRSRPVDRAPARAARLRRAVRAGALLAGAVAAGGALVVGAARWPDRASSAAEEQSAAPAGGLRCGPSVGTAPTSGTAPAGPASAADLGSADLGSAGLGSAGLGSVDLGSVVVRLAAERARVLAAGRVTGLDAIAEQGSPAAAADRALLHRLDAAGVRLAGLRFGICEVRVIDHGGAGPAATVTVTARVVTSAHRRVPRRGSADGGQPVAASAPQPVRLVLVRGPAGWRVRSVSAEPEVA